MQPQRWEDEMIQDLRYGVRMLLKREPSGKKLDESHLNHFRHAGVTRSHKAL
jgi:hypothetical protein